MFSSAALFKHTEYKAQIFFKSENNYIVKPICPSNSYYFVKGKRGGLNLLHGIIASFL